MSLSVVSLNGVEGKEGGAGVAHGGRGKTVGGGGAVLQMPRWAQVIVFFFALFLARSEGASCAGSISTKARPQANAKSDEQAPVVLLC